MKKLFIFLILLVFAILIAGLCGVLHNQVSYTVSPEYFTKFKFRQFGFVDLPLPERVRASMVGFLASWWMGIPIGILVGTAGFMHPGPSRMFQVTIWSFALAIIFTLFFGLCGLFYGYLQTRTIDLANYRNWFIPDDVVNMRRFLCAGYMHNSSYLGGVLAVIVAWIFHVTIRLRNKSAVATQTASHGENNPRDK